MMVPSLVPSLHIIPYQGGTARDDCQVGIASQLGSVNGGIFFIQWQQGKQGNDDDIFSH